MKTLKWLWSDDSGQDLTEYALLLSIIALGAIASMGKLATTINAIFQNAVTNLTPPPQ